MQPRLTEAALERVRLAIDALPVPQVVKDGIEWDAMPALTPEGLCLVPMIMMKVPGTVMDYVLKTGVPGLEVHEGQSEWNEAIRRLYGSAQEECDQRAALSNGNGHRPAGGLWTPGG